MKLVWLFETIFLIFNVEMIQFDEHILQMGWVKNHQSRRAWNVVTPLRPKYRALERRSCLPMLRAALRLNHVANSAKTSNPLCISVGWVTKRG